jgi:hypothetical protein
MLANCRVRSVFSFILFHYTPSLTPQRQPHARAGLHSLISFQSLISLLGAFVFSTHKSMWLQPCSVSLHTASPPHTKAPNRSFTSFHSIRSFRPALAFSNANVRAKKMRQTGCRQHPATALCASCVWGIRSTRSGSHTTHRLNTSFRFSSLAFQPCYPRWLKAVFTIRFKPASPTPTPDHPPLI